MKIVFHLLFLVCWHVMGFSQEADSVYLFCSFKGNGEGLHYAYSENGFKWKLLFNDSIVLKSTISRNCSVIPAL